MRCSRVGGVILYSFDNGHFMAYTSPPPTAEPLLKEKPFGECTFQLSPIAVQRLHSYSTRPRGTPILIGAGWRSQTEGEIFKGTDGACADPGTQNFPCHGACTQPTLPPSSFISLTFTSQRSLLWYFLGLQESTVPPRSSYSSPQKNEPPPSCDDGGVRLAIIPGFRRAARPRDILPRGCPRRNRRPCPPGLRGCSG